MTPRQRVLAALQHSEPDRVPIVIGISNSTGLKMAAYRGLKAHLGFEAKERYLYDWPELGTAMVDEPVLERLRSDVRGVLDAHPAEEAQALPGHFSRSQIKNHVLKGFHPYVQYGLS